MGQGGSSSAGCVRSDPQSLTQSFLPNYRTLLFIFVKSKKYFSHLTALIFRKKATTLRNNFDYALPNRALHVYMLGWTEQTNHIVQLAFVLSTTLGETTSYCLYQCWPYLNELLLDAYILLFIVTSYCS